MIAAAALPVAGNVFILASHYRVAPKRVSTSILISATVALITVSVIIGWVSGLY
jgi:predicted permease